MTVRVTADQLAEKWARRTAAATPDYISGVSRVTEAPGMKAGKNEQGYLNGVQEAVTSGRWKRGVESVSLSEWQDKAVNKGAGRIAQGVEAAKSKMADIAVRLIANVEKAQAEVERIPPVSFEARMQRMVVFATSMHNNPVK